jgi:hypothetical protein
VPDAFKKIPKIWQKWFRDRKRQGNNLKRANLFNNVFIFILIVQCVMMIYVIIWRNVRIKCLKKVKSQWCDEKNKLKKILLVFQREKNGKQICFLSPNGYPNKSCDVINFMGMLVNKTFEKNITLYLFTVFLIIITNDDKNNRILNWFDNFFFWVNLSFDFGKNQYKFSKPFKSIFFSNVAMCIFHILRIKKNLAWFKLTLIIKATCKIFLKN